MLISKSVAFTLFVLFFTCIAVQATHLRAGDITVKRLNCESLTFEITITVYTNTGSQVLFGGRQGDEDMLDFGDGTAPYLVPETPNTPRPDLGTNIGTASFTIFHTYSSPGKYLISYREPNRNEGVLNMDNSVNTPFYLETEINIDPFLGCNNTPRLLIAPIDQACPGVAFFHNPGAFDPDGDSLSYELVVPFSDRNIQVIRFQDPSTNQPRQFYSNYSIGNEDASGPPDFVINPVSGTVVWDAPGLQGEYNIAFIVREWRNIDGQWVSLGYVRRDMQIIAIDCKNNRPDLIIPEDICVEAGTELKASILGIDPDFDSVKIEAFSEIFNFSESAATYSPKPPKFQSSNPSAELKFEWKTQCSHVKEQPYQVVFKITDSPPKGPKLVTFKSWNIKVVGPAPKWETITLNSNRSASLKWEDYTCSNADKIQVWRKVESFPYDPANCETGMPEFLGFELITTLSLKNSNGNPVTAYTDTNGGKGLAPGAQYCYRLVATFPLPKGGESYMSKEFCLDPIKADVPIITHVTIDKTSSTNGQITVRWLPPFDVPNDYTYQVFRGEGFAGPQGSNPIHPGQLNANTLVFTDVGLNTENVVYNYRIDAFINGILIGSSVPASSVRLEVQSQLQRIELNWSAFVPWSNQTPQYPTHLVYRGAEGATESQFVQIASVNVTANGFHYIDEGQYNNTPLRDDQIYCYRVMTRGGYGNPLINEPFENFSQIVCAQPSDTIIPCKVDYLVAIDAPDCSDPASVTAQCSNHVFSNTIAWKRPTTGDCQNDIAYYKIYSASSSNLDYEFRAIVIGDTIYVDKGLPSNAYCYQVSAVDRSGNEGEKSDPICIDNCPYYELPNVFTPNPGVDDCNTKFSAFSGNGRYEILPKTDPDAPASYRCGGVSDPSKCARFVEQVDFKVYNRWGKEVYSYRSGEERTIYIDWDGRDNDGRELSTGIYYYMAEVTFTTSDPEKRNQILKGWVHLLR